MQPSIEVHGLRKRYGRTVAVDGVSFALAPGKVTGFVGPNGAGKSTTMRLVLGLDAPDEGVGLVGGQPYRSLRKSAGTSRRIAGLRRHPSGPEGP